MAPIAFAKRPEYNYKESENGGFFVYRDTCEVYFYHDEEHAKTHVKLANNWINPIGAKNVEDMVKDNVKFQLWTAMRDIFAERGVEF